MKALNHTSNLFKEKRYLTNIDMEDALMRETGIALKYLAAFDLLRTVSGRKTLEEYYTGNLSVVEKQQSGFVIESPTWRANPDWGFKLGYTHDELFVLNRQSIKFIRDVANNYATVPHIIMSGNIGPRDEKCNGDTRMNIQEAKAYHIEQVKAFVLADADVVTAVSIAYADEAIGIVNAARSFGMPVVISFSVESDGNLPGGESLQHAIEKVDSETDYYVQHFMIDRDLTTIRPTGDWLWRIGGIRANVDYEETLSFLPNLKVTGLGRFADHLQTASHLRALL